MRELRNSIDIADDNSALRKRLINDGYLFLPGYLNRAKLETVRRDLQVALAAVGWIDNPDALHLNTKERSFTGQSFANGYASVQSIESFHRLGHDEQILSLMSRLLLNDVFCHPAKVCRVAYPRDAGMVYSTKPHQDFGALHVCSDVLTAWIPLCSCNEQRPGIELLPASHCEGYYPTDPSIEGARPLYIAIRSDDPRWATTRYEVGDLLIFHSLTVHAARVNCSDALRLSVDFRYQSIRDPMRPEFTHPHGYPQTPDWDELTKKWTSQQWIAMPDTAPLIPFPEEIDFTTYMATLTAPPSRLMPKA